MKLIKNKNLIDKFKKAEVLVEVKDLKLSYRTKNGKKLIIDNANFKVRRGEILGIIGESGSGKSVLTSALLGLKNDLEIFEEGEMKLKGIDLTVFNEEDWNKSGLRGKVVSQVFQNPLSSLNPYIKIKKQIGESIKINNPGKKISSDELYDLILDLLESVKISNAVEVMEMYPHQMSGGMNQRIVICTILSAKPELIIFDEPTTALDPIAQATIIEIIRDIRDKTNIGIIFISHDISLVSNIVDSIAIMYAGTIIEYGQTKEIAYRPLHPYTWGLMRSIPELSTIDGLYTIPGQVPNDISKIKGDAFAPRNQYALEIDFHKKPPTFKASNTHWVKSWLYDPRTPDFKPPKIAQGILGKNKKWN